ncbi:Pre protein translocase Sec Sec61-beta subunit [Russula vinacea]|nr:Pre protein translocase Sec Sec61-beta subunit [Russula vinacea]
MSDSDTTRSTPSRSASSAVANRPAPKSGTFQPNSSRSAGAGGSSNTMLKLYTDDSPGLRVDPFIVLVLSLSFIASIFFLHISAKIIRAFSK